MSKMNNVEENKPVQDPEISLINQTEFSSRFFFCER